MDCSRLEEHCRRLASQSDTEQRFKSFDSNPDGMLTEEEFVKVGTQ
jgi:hypothetical protein